jgi:serine/threonine-protein kinase
LDPKNPGSTPEEAANEETFSSPLPADEALTVADIRKIGRPFSKPPSEPPLESGARTSDRAGPSSRPPIASTRPLPLDADEEPPPLESIPPVSEEFTEPWTARAAMAVEPTASMSGVSTGGTNTASTSASTASTGGRGLLEHEAVKRERLERNVAGLRAMFFISLGGAIALQFAPDKPITHFPATAALCVLGLVAGISAWLLRIGVLDDGGIIGNAVVLLGACVTLALVGHLGVLSPVTMALTIIVSFDGASDQRLRGKLVYVTAAIGYAVLVLLACFHVIPPLLPAKGHIDPKATLLFGVTGEGMLFAAYWVAVVSRRRTLEAMARLESAHVEIRRRQALLDEVRADLDRALDAARVGRFTGQEIGPFLANEVIGRGGMGEVYRGVRVETGELVALKVLHAQFQGEKDQLERFFREAEVTSQLASPHIVRVLDRGRAPDGSPFLAMELLVGYDLAHALRRHSRLGMNDVLEMVTHVAGGLSAAQEAGIVHRDIKPQNVFRARVGGTAMWKVLDFGVSKINDFAGTLTHGAIVGTPGYMSPEQARGMPLSHRSDVFSLGALAYRALTGRPAFHASDPLSTTYQVVHKMPARPSEIVPKLHGDVDKVLALALAKDSKDRFKSAVSFAAALRDASRGELDDRLRDAATELLGRHPWGAEKAERKD